MNATGRALDQVPLNVPDISCGHCERVITQTLAAVAGVHRVAVDSPAKRVRIDHDRAVVGIDAVKDVVAEAD